MTVTACESLVVVFAAHPTGVVAEHDVAFVADQEIVEDFPLEETVVGFAESKTVGAETGVTGDPVGTVPGVA